MSLKRWHKIISGIIIFFIVVLFALPRAGRWYVVKHSDELIHRKLEIEKIRINYFTGTLKVKGLKLYESDSKTVFLSLNQFKINIDYFPLLRNELFVRYITLDDPFVEVLQKGEKFNFSDLTPTDTASVVKKDTIPSKPTKYIINNIIINRGYVKYTDLQLNHTIALNRLDLLIPGFTWNSDSTNLNVNFKFVDGGGLRSHLEVNQADSTYAINLQLDSLNLNIIEPYLKSYIHISALHGLLTNNVVIKGNMRSVMQLFIRGMNSVSDFSMTDTLNRNIFSFRNLTVDIDTIQLDKYKVKLKTINLTDPSIFVEMIDSTNNWLALIKPSVLSSTDTAHAGTQTETGSYSFSDLKINGGKVIYSDKTLRFPFEYTVNNISLESSPVNNSAGKYSFRMSAGLNETGTFSMNGILNPVDYKDMDIAMTVGQFRMKDIDAYFKHYFGFPVTGGIMNFKTDNKIRPESLISNNNLYVRKFTLDKRLKTKVEYKVPLRLALGILSDKDGIIDLKIPVETKGSDVKVKNLGKIILKVIGNLFIKAAVSPFNLISSSYKVDPSTLQEIRLNMTEVAPDEQNLKSVDIMADILNRKPAISLDFYYCSDRSKLVDSMAYLMTRDDYVKANKNTGVNTHNIPDSTLMKYIISKSALTDQNSTQDLKMLCRNYIGTNKIETFIDSVKTLQLSFITNYLTHDKVIPAERFRVISVSPDTIKPSGNYPAFRVYFSDPGDK